MSKYKKIDKSFLALAGEFTVAAHLCRNNIYAQLTLGNQKRVDLLVRSGTGKFCTIEVKAKQTPVWPNCHGISDKHAFLVLVDFAKPPQNQPDFYVLNNSNWRAIVRKARKRYKTRHPAHKVWVKDNILHAENTAKGKQTKGVSVKVEDVKNYLGQWRKIQNALK